MTRRRPLLLLLATIGWLVAVAAPASAACHVAGFVEESVSGEEAVGDAVLVVELRGRVASCEGTVDVATADGTAVAGEDYEAFSATLEFVEGDDRVETIDLVLLDDDAAEGDETFTVVLSNATGSISSTGGDATVTIVDDEGADGGDEPADEPTDATTAPEPTAVPADDATDAGEDTEDVAADDAAAEDDGSATTILLVALGVLVLAGGGFALSRRS